MPAPENPYAGGMGNPHRLPATPQQQYAEYAVPGVNETGPYTKEYGWGPHLETSPQSTPDASRLAVIPRYDFRPDPVRSPNEFYGRRDADDKRRHSVENQDADGWSETKQAPGYINPGGSAVNRWAPNPRATPPPESRVTQQMSPRTYSFLRPFDQFNRNYNGEQIGTARRFNGFHFSLADHRRTYPILGMTPVKTWRNTYRLNPPPWDADIVDMPPAETQEVIPGRITSTEVPATRRSYRL